MKKLTYLLAAAAVFAACNSGNKGYTVTGTVEGAADGDTVYLQTAEGRQLVKTRFCSHHQPEPSPSKERRTVL